MEKEEVVEEIITYVQTLRFMDTEMENYEIQKEMSSDMEYCPKLQPQGGLVVRGRKLEKE